MKISPLAQGSGVPSQATNPVGSDNSRMARAKAIAAGQEPPAPVESSGDPQVDKLKRIKMRTQVSTNRDDAVVQEPAVVEQSVAEMQQSPVNDTVEQTQSTEETRPLSPQFAALAKAKRALQVKERELAQREAALTAQPPAATEDVIAKLKANPLGVLQEAGVTYDQLTEAILANQSNPEIVSLKADIKALKEELTGQLASRDQMAETQVLAEIKREAERLVQAEPEKYEAIKLARGEEYVKDLVHRTWKETGELLSTEEAADLVENQLLEEALPFAKIKKVQSRLTPPVEQVVQAPTPQPKPNTKIMRTLTNRDTAQPLMDPRARAIAAALGTLKKG